MYLHFGDVWGMFLTIVEDAACSFAVGVCFCLDSALGFWACVYWCCEGGGRGEEDEEGGWECEFHGDGALRCWSGRWIFERVK